MGVNTFVSFVAITPVDCVEPRVVVLGATAVVAGVESAMITDNLSFRYAAAPPADKPAGTTDDCVPILERFATPAAALPPGLAPTPGAVPVTPGALTPTVGGTRLEVRPGEAGRLDLIFVIDQTGSMQPVFNQVQRTAKEIFASIAARFPDHRVAVVAYRDWSDGDGIFQDFPFTTDEAEFQKAVDSLKASGGGDTPRGGARGPAARVADAVACRRQQADHPDGRRPAALADSQRPGQGQDRQTTSSSWRPRSTRR